jgi:hypothetical protein
MDARSGWFSSKLKALVPLLVSGQGMDDELVTAPPADQLSWRGLAMVFVDRKVGQAWAVLTLLCGCFGVCCGATME